MRKSAADTISPLHDFHTSYFILHIRNALYYNFLLWTQSFPGYWGNRNRKPSDEQASVWGRIVIRWATNACPLGKNHPPSYSHVSSADTTMLTADGIVVPAWRYTYLITYIPIGYRGPDATLQGIICRNIGEKPYVFLGKAVRICSNNILSPFTLSSLQITVL